MATHGKEVIGNRIDGWMILGDRRESPRERRREKIKKNTKFDTPESVSNIPEIFLADSEKNVEN